jgi:hypothetical protein
LLIVLGRLGAVVLGDGRSLRFVDVERGGGGGRASLLLVAIVGVVEVDGVVVVAGAVAVVVVGAPFGALLAGVTG